MNESMEMYLETIYRLEEDNGHAHGAEIAKRLGVTKPSVTKAMNVLKLQGLIVKEKYGTITLTKEGCRLSKSIFEKHIIISEYLVKSLGLSTKEAVDNACKMEHIISDEMLEAIKVFLSKNSVER